MTMEKPVQGSDARSRRPLGFPPGSTVDVRQVDDQDWVTLRALEYQANTDYFKVPINERTDFASVPRVFCGLSLATAATPKLLSCTTTSAASLSGPAASAESRQTASCGRPCGNSASRSCAAG